MSYRNESLIQTLRTRLATISADMRTLAGRPHELASLETWKRDVERMLDEEERRPVLVGPEIAQGAIVTKKARGRKWHFVMGYPTILEAPGMVFADPGMEYALASQYGYVPFTATAQR